MSQVKCHKFNVTNKTSQLKFHKYNVGTRSRLKMIICINLNRKTLIKCNQLNIMQHPMSALYGNIVCHGTLVENTWANGFKIVCQSQN
jgi:hypothetical protein